MHSSCINRGRSLGEPSNAALGYDSVMQITKYTHACVRLEHEGRVLVIDPGEWAEPEAVRGADAVLVTHEHSDHIEVARLAEAGIPVFAPAGADITGLDVTWVTTEQVFDAAGFKVRAVGSRHAFIYSGRPDCPNLGYVVEDQVYVPGDALFVPDQPIETLFVPAQGSWMKLVEVIDFVRAIKPTRAHAIHDAGLSDRGLDSANAWFELACETDYRWLAPGETA
jgi:L-ascorbate metabolism protein UlaG (beta-lactamase superfamily)